MARPVAKLLLLFSGIIAALLLGLLAFTLTRPNPPLLSMPSPNGYADFVAAGKMLVGESADYRVLPSERLRALVLTNAECLKRLRIGLTRECRVPMDYSQEVTNHLTELPLMKRLGSALAAEGRLAELEKRPGDAARAYVDGLRFGQESVRGGIIIDALVGIAIEALHCTQLEKLSPTLDAPTCRQLAVALEEFEGRRVAPAEVLQCERTWVRRAYGLRGMLQQLLSFKAVRGTERGLVSRLTAQQSRTRVLLVNVAARAYELEKGQPPASLTDLVPAYLKTVPQAPGTGTNLVLRR